MVNETQKYAAADKDRPKSCVLCYVGVPGGSSVPSGGHHHIIPRGRLPGENNEEYLWSPVNIALACQEHHELFGHDPTIWMSAMIMAGFASPDAYTAHWYLPAFVDPRVAQCIGRWGFGDAWAKERGITDSERVAFTGTTDKLSDSFCAMMCPRACLCIEETRKAMYGVTE